VPWGRCVGWCLEFRGCRCVVRCRYGRYGGDGGGYRGYKGGEDGEGVRWGMRG